MTITTYSKPPGDVAAHTARLAAENTALLARQKAVMAQLQGQPRRVRCLLCGSALADAVDMHHRGVPYVLCGHCGHLQIAVEIPAGYPQDYYFSGVYPSLDEAAFRQRVAQIYQPKLAWALDAAKSLGLGDLLAQSWTEIGSGAGYFLAALRSTGAKQIRGLESEAALLARAQSVVGEAGAHLFQGSLGDAFNACPAEVYAAWFVVEHCFDLPGLIEGLRNCPRGTVFLFSVPTFGFATLLDCAFQNHFARNLDSILHLQLFTDRSIRFLLDEAGYEIGAEWIFGQDADDLVRALMIGLEPHLSPRLLSAQRQSLAAPLAPLQEAIDRARIADARHILAIRR